MIWNCSTRSSGSRGDLSHRNQSTLLYLKQYSNYNYVDIARIVVYFLPFGTLSLNNNVYPNPHTYAQICIGIRTGKNTIKIVRTSAQARKKRGDYTLSKRAYFQIEFDILAEKRSTVAHWYVICFSSGGLRFKYLQGTIFQNKMKNVKFELLRCSYSHI